MKTLQLITIMLTVSLLWTNTLNSQSTDEQCNEISEWMFKATESNSIILWEKVINTLEEKEDAHSKLQLAYAHYGLTTACLANQDKKKGKSTAKNGLAHALQLIEDEQHTSEAHAIVAGLYGMSIAFSPMKGMYLGPKSDKHVKLAMEVDDQCAFAWLQKGSSEINTPKLFGGDVDASVISFEKALSIYDKSDDPFNWQRIETLVWLGQAYHQTDQPDKAIETYNKVLEAMPDYGWVKEKLLPDALQAQ